MEYLVPIIALTASFISTILCIVFIFGKRFYLWVSPLLCSLILFVCNILFVYGLADSKLTSVSSDILDYSTLALLLLSVLFLILTVIIRILGVPKDTKAREGKRSKSEARYVSVGFREDKK